MSSEKDDEKKAKITKVIDQEILEMNDHQIETAIREQKEQERKDRENKIREAKRSVRIRSLRKDWKEQEEKLRQLREQYENQR